MQTVMSQIAFFVISGGVNYEGSYFLVNYDNYEIIITKGFQYNKDEMLYKLSEVEKKTESGEENKENQNEKMSDEK